MNIQEIRSKTDLTFLRNVYRSSDFVDFVDAAIRDKYRSICTFPGMVLSEIRSQPIHQVVRDAGLKVCVVSGFPHGHDPFNIKNLRDFKFDVEGNGEINIIDVVDEIDVVPYLPCLKDGFPYILELQLKHFRTDFKGKVLKVIIETEQLSDDDIKTACKVCNDTGVDFIKTCTGFYGKLSDRSLDLVLANKGNCKVKASGGIKTPEKAAKLLERGVDVIGTSAFF